MTRVSVLDHLGDRRPEVEGLLTDLEAATGHPALPDAKWAEVRGRKPPTGFSVLAETDGGLVGYGHALRPDDSGPWYVQAAAPPDAPAVVADVATACVTEAARRGGGPVHLWVFCADGEADRLAASLGGRPVRDVVQMRRPLPHPDPARLPEDCVLRAFRPGEDDAAWLAVNGAAFADHPEQRSFSQADLAARMAEPWFDPADLLVLEDAEGMAGFCWVKAVEGGDPHGEIYVIASHPRRQGEGLGRALTLAGLGRMTEHGLPEARLYVDGGNAAGLALYESLGFDRHHADRVYEIVP